MGTKRGVIAAWMAWAVEQDTDECLDPPFSPSKRYLQTWLPETRSREPAHWTILRLKDRALPTGKQVVRHLCGFSRCLNHRHLLVGTVEENEADKKVHGTACWGEQHHHAKLTENDVRIIRASEKSGSALAREYGMNHRTINRIRAGEGWSQVW